VTVLSAANGRRSPGWTIEHVRRAAAGEHQAWNQLVEEFEGMVWAVARGHRLRDPDAADVVQTAWMRLAENLDRLHDPSRVGAWLATTARRECLRALRASTRELPDAEPPEPDGEAPPIDGGLLTASAIQRFGPPSGASRPATRLSCGSSWPNRSHATTRLPRRSGCRWAASAQPADGRSTGCAANWSAAAPSSCWRPDGGVRRTRQRPLDLA
jgi:RNA polymerase sigma factor (sigma-70 family)